MSISEVQYSSDSLPRGSSSLIPNGKRIDTMTLFPGSWSAVIATALIGTFAYLFVYWIRLKEINRTRDPKDQLTLKELIEEDWGVVLKTVRNENKEETKPTEQRSKPALRRGSSSGNLKGLSKNRPVLKRMSSGSGATLRISMSIW